MNESLGILCHRDRRSVFAERKEVIPVDRPVQHPFLTSRHGLVGPAQKRIRDLTTAGLQLDAGRFRWWEEWREEIETDRLEHARLTPKQKFFLFR